MNKLTQIRPGKSTTGTAAANTQVVVTLAAPADASRRHVIVRVAASYSAAPTGGRLSISDGSTVFDVDITAAGPTVIDLNTRFAAGQAVVVTLAAGSGTVVGKLNVVAYEAERF